MPDLVSRLNAALEGRYRIERELGAGGMATVYLADDLRHERRVALKVLKPELAAVVGAERFLAEIKTTASLQHPHILPLFDSGEADGFLFYVMPYVEGESLRERLDREHQLPVEEAVRIATDVAGALHAAHEAGVIHRDVKPANILLSRGGPLVADFGIALAASASRLTETGLSLGTPHYMSPEQVTGDQQVQPATDVFALACVLFEMLVGEPPHIGSTVQAVLGRIIVGERASAASRRRSIPANVDAALGRALERLPADRFTTTRAFAQALADPSFRHLDAAASGGPPSSRRRLAVAASVTSILFLAGAGLTWAVMRAAPPAAPSAMEPSVAVLPFENLSAEPEQYVSDGFAAALIDALTRIPGLKVTARPSSFAFRESDLDLRAIADSLGVANLVSGSVQREADRVLVVVQLIEARSGFNLWSDSFDRQLTGMIDMQEEVARSIADGLRVELTGVEGDRLAGQPPASADAYNHYLRARHLLYERSPEGFRGAIASFSRAIAIDPSYAPAYAGMAVSHSLAVQFSAAPPDSSYEWAGRAIAYANRAVELDSLSGEAYAARGVATVAFAMGLAEPYDRAGRDLRRALSIQPSSSDFLGWYAQWLSHEGRHDEAVATNDRVMSLDPVSPGRRIGYAASTRWTGRHAATLEQVRLARAIQPAIGGLATMMEAEALVLLGRGAECVALEVDLPWWNALCLHAVGRVEQAATLVDSLAEDWSPASPLLEADGLISYYAWTGQLEETLRWVERGLSAHPTLNAGYLIPRELWDPVLAQGADRVEAAVRDLWETSWRRVLRESERVVLP